MNITQKLAMLLKIANTLEREGYTSEDGILYKKVVQESGPSENFKINIKIEGDVITLYFMYTKFGTAGMQINKVIPSSWDGDIFEVNTLSDIELGCITLGASIT